MLYVQFDQYVFYDYELGFRQNCQERGELKNKKIRIKLVKEVRIRKTVQCTYIYNNPIQRWSSRQGMKINLVMKREA